MNSVKLKPGRYSIRRHRDAMGDSGMMFHPVDRSKGLERAGEEGEIIVGKSVICGSHYGRTLESQDWWLTTPVSEIISVNEDSTEVVFKTGNSLYTAKSF